MYYNWCFEKSQANSARKAVAEKFWSSGLRQNRLRPSGIDLGYELCNTRAMRSILLILVIALQGCAYTVTSTVTTIATGKSVTDHVLSTTGNDCNTIKYARQQQDYLCERPRDPGTHYNRNAY